MREPVSNRIDLCAWLQGMYGMGKKYMTFKHWKTGEIKTIEFREADVPANPSNRKARGLERDRARNLRT